MMNFLRSTVKVSCPQVWRFARRLKEKAVCEYYLLRHLRWRQLLRHPFGSRVNWESALPLQTPRRVVLPDCEFATIDVLIQELAARGLDYAAGSAAVYLPPATVTRSAFRALHADYPADAGLKILRTPGGVGESAYGEGVLRKVLDHDLLLVANLLHDHELGPRIYDLLEIQFGDRVWTAYVVQHVTGRPPTEAECAAGVARMRELEARGLLSPTAVWGFQNVDFQPPACNGNALIDERGRFHYIDFQNFAIRNYGEYLERMAREASAHSHFGRQRLLGDGRFLYQSIPGVNLPAKRSVQARFATIDGLLRSADVSVKHRLVLDVGCNVGMMMAEYLRAGAKWCHGWDLPQVTPFTERLLGALGCTRFSTTGVSLGRPHRLEDDLPPFLQASLGGCAISYLAVRGHLGWLDALSRIPWSFMIYEGHETDSLADVEAHLRELRESVEFETRAMTTYQDGASNPRVAGVLVRRSKPPATGPASKIT